MGVSDLSLQLKSELALTAVPAVAGAARSFVRQCLAQWKLDLLVDDAELVVSELFANAVNATRRTEHGNPATVIIRLAVIADSLVVEVWDRILESPRSQQPEQAAEDGRGLLIVGALCRRWYYFFPDSGGKTVCGELAIPEHISVSSDP